MSEAHEFRIGIGLIQPSIDTAIAERASVGFDSPNDFGVFSTYEGKALAIGHSDPPRIVVNLSTWAGVCERNHADAIIRHEVDHIAFFTLPIFREMITQAKKLNKLSDECKKSGILTPEYRKCLTQYQKTYTETYVLSEARAFFFEYVAVGQWSSANYPGIKKKVKKVFAGGYSGDIFRDVDRMGQIKDVPEWTAQIMDTIDNTIDALAEAFQHPDRFARARIAKTVDEYLELCV